jgi:ketosteroid isomerase-like protein
MASPNLDLVRSIYADWARGDWSSAEWADPEIEFVMEGEVFPDPGVHRGVEAMGRAWYRWLEAWEDVHGSEPELIDRGDRVVALYTIHARGRSSGVELEAVVANVFTLRAGKVVRLSLLSREQALKEAGIDQ